MSKAAPTSIQGDVTDGTNAGATTQDPDAIAVGQSAGLINQGEPTFPIPTISSLAAPSHENSDELAEFYEYVRCEKYDKIKIKRHKNTMETLDDYYNRPGSYYWSTGTCIEDMDNFMRKVELLQFEDQRASAYTNSMVDPVMEVQRSPMESSVGFQDRVRDEGPRFNINALVTEFDGLQEDQGVGVPRFLGASDVVIHLSSPENSSSECTRPIYCHSFILASQCGFFRPQFMDDTPWAQPLDGCGRRVVRLQGEDVSFETLKNAIRMMYDTVTPSALSVLDLQACWTFAGGFLDAQRVVSMIENALIRKLSSWESGHEVECVLSWVNDCEKESFQTEIFRVLRRNLTAFLKCPESYVAVAVIPYPHLCQIFASDDTDVDDEALLVETALIWAHCHGLSYASEEMSQLLDASHIRYQFISQKNKARCHSTVIAIVSERQTILRDKGHSSFQRSGVHPRMTSRNTTYVQNRRRSLITQQEENQRADRQAMSRGGMMCRMFHPSNGRCNFDNLSVNASYMLSPDDNHDAEKWELPLLPPNFVLPPPDEMAAMLHREEALRLSKQAQETYASKYGTSSLELTQLLQLQVVREYGYSDAFVRILRSAASLYSREELPFEKLPHYVRFNRSEMGCLRVGDRSVDVKLSLLTPGCYHEATHCEVDADAAALQVQELDKSVFTGTSSMWTLDQMCRQWMKVPCRPMVIAAGSFT